MRAASKPSSLNSDADSCECRSIIAKLNDTEKKVASRKGFEPLTPGLGNLCSILLSYREVYRSYSVLIRYSAAPTRPYAYDPVSLLPSRASN
jgi:hypothetical protein